MDENEEANEKIDIYLAIKSLIQDGNPVTMIGISKHTGMDSSHIWRMYGLSGHLSKMIDDIEYEVRQAKD